MWFELCCFIHRCVCNCVGGINFLECTIHCLELEKDAEVINDETWGKKDQDACVCMLVCLCTLYMCLYVSACALLCVGVTDKVQGHPVPALFLSLSLSIVKQAPPPTQSDCVSNSTQPLTHEQTLH